MLIHDDGATWTAIGQPAHAWLAGQLARAWQTPLDDALMLAIEQHDVAWADLDRAPHLQVRAGRAAAFLELPASVRHAAWEGVADRLVAQDPHAALLVSLHATNIHTRYGDPDRRPVEFLERQRADQDALLATLAAEGVTRERAEAEADVLFCLDALSLALCSAKQKAALPLPGGATMSLQVEPDGGVSLDPWPFAPPEVRCWLHARVFAERFEDEGSLREAVLRAPWQRLEWLLRPAGDPRTAE